MPFNFRNKDRIKNLIQELKEYRYKNIHEIESFLHYTDEGIVGNRIPEGEPVTVGVGYRFKGYDQYSWFCTNILIPDELILEEVVGLFDFGVPVGTGNNSHFESLLYLNNEPYQGVDGNHQEVFLNPKVNGKNLDLKFRVWSGLNGGGRPKEMAMEIERASFAVLDHPTDDFYFLSKNAIETYELLSDQSEYKEWLLNQLVQAFNLVDYTEPKSQSFYESMKMAYDYLCQQLDGRGKLDVTISMIGHTHIDVAWLWRLRHTREKAARSFSTVDRLMEQYDEYKFLQSQPQLYESIKEDYPDIYKKIKKRVAEGKWEPSGAMWVECDCNLVSGESIVRQLLVGKNFFQKEFGVESEFLWLPDVFGYSWALPQILKKSNINTFMTTKISWNDMNKMPYDTFDWVGIDGSHVLTHFITTKDNWEGANSYTYNGDTRPYAVKGAWDNYSNKDTNRELLISYGYGDGGGGPTRDMIKNIECLNKIPGIPKVKNETATMFFRHLHEVLSKNEMNGYLPKWDGELYLEFHRGTYTSQAYNKKMNRRMEELIRNTEIISVLAEHYSDYNYPKEELLKIWKILLTQQFHDILPGSSIHEVYEDSHTEYEKVQETLNHIMKQALEQVMMPMEKAYTVWNDSNWSRDSYIRILDADNRDIYTDADGQLLKSYCKNKVATILLKDMEPMSFTTIYKQDKFKSEPVLEQGCNEFETNYYHVAFNNAGQIIRLFDKEAQREVFLENQKGNVFQIFEDKPYCFDAWELEATINQKKEEINNCSKIEIEKNQLGIFVSLEWAYHKSKISQTICFYDDKKRIDFKTRIDWQEQQKLLKTAFEVNIRAADARFDIQYGNIKRTITSNNSWEAAKFEVVAHKWMDLQETGYGIALLNNCKYGHDIKEGVMRLTLLKSAIDPDYLADRGIHEFSYALLPHSLEWYMAQIEQEAFDLNHELTAITGTMKNMPQSILIFSKENVSLDCIKIAENSNDVVVRFHEFHGRRTQIELNCSLEYDSWQECNLMEAGFGEIKTQPISLEIKPYEIISILLKRNEKAGI